MFQDGEQGAAMREAGAVTYLTKTGPAEALVETIRACVRVSEKIHFTKSGKVTIQKSGAGTPSHRTNTGHRSYERCFPY